MNNGLEVAPPEKDGDNEVPMPCAWCWMEKAPLVHADHIRVSVQNHILTLEGPAGAEEGRKMAELDAW